MSRPQTSESEPVTDATLAASATATASGSASSVSASASGSASASVSRQQLKAERTERLLREAARLFAARGYRGVSLEELAAEVGISGPALYRHFSNKEAILAEVLGDVSNRLLAGGQERVAAAVDSAAALAALVDFHADFALHETDRIRVHNRDLATLAPEMAGSIRTVQRQYVNLWVDALVDQTGDEREVARLKVQAAIGLLNSTPHSVRRVDAGAVKPVLVQMTLAALLSQA